MIGILRSCIMAALAWGLLAPAISANDGVIVKTKDAKPGVYYLMLTIGEDGSTQIETLSLREHSIAGQTPIPPGSPSPPNAPPDAPHEEGFDSIAHRLLTRVTQDPEKENTAKAVAAIYRTTAELATISSPQLLKIATDTLFREALSRAGKLEAWGAWKTSIDGAIAQKLKGKPLDAWREAWRKIAQGVEQ